MIFQKKCLILIIFTASLFLTCDSAQTYNHDITSYRNQTWMSLLDSGILIRQMNIVGTHNSLGLKNCLGLGSFQQCQSNPLQIQLQSGIRAIDIRVQHLNNRFQLFDRSCDLGANFDNVLTTVSTFLTTYPTQTVLLHLVEQKGPSGCSRTFEDTFLYYKTAYPNVFWVPTTQDPQLGDVRGQILLIQQFTANSIYGLIYATFTTQQNMQFKDNWSLCNKWNAVKSFLASANNAKKSRISYWTGHGGSYPYFVASGHSDPSTNAPRLWTGYTTPGMNSYCPDLPRINCAWIFVTVCSIFFQGINTLGYNYINSQGFTYMGIVFLNFYGSDLLTKIVGKNNALFGMCTFLQKSEGCTYCTLAGVCMKCNTKANYVYDPVALNCLAAPGYFLNALYIPISCSSVMPGCQLCISATTCTLCDTLNNYLLSGLVCIAAPGFYLNISFFPVPCPQIGCDQCIDQLVCTICSANTNYVIDPATNTTCMCDGPAHFISAPSTPACICDVGYFLDLLNTCQLQPRCPDPYNGCITCAPPVSNVCLLCDTASNFIFDPTGLFCICDIGYFFNGTQCDLCNTVDAACNKCASSTLCIACDTNFTLVKGVCQCVYSYFKVNTTTCNACSTGCLTCSALGSCTVCDTPNYFTLAVTGYCQCIVGMFQASGSCHLCGSMAGCLDCNSLGCISCNAVFGFSLLNGICVCAYGFFINAMSICEKCTAQGCLNCLDQIICTTCDTSLYYLNSFNTCDDICGDGVLIYVQCDDGNLLNGDGCSNSCFIETDYTCIGGSMTSASICSYSGLIYLDLLSTVKDITKNQVLVSFKISPNILCFNSLDFSAAMVPSFPYQQKTVIFNNVTGQIWLRFTYNQSLNSMTSSQLQVQFQPPTNTSASFYYMKASVVALPSITDNNMALKYYSPQIYQMIGLVTTLSKVTAFIYVGVTVVSFLFVSKLIAVQLILLPQLTFAGLIMIYKLQSLLLPLNNLFPVNGYNPLFQTTAVLPSRISGLYYRGGMIVDFNINIVIIILPVLVAMIILIVGSKTNNKNTKKSSYKALKQWTFGVILILQVQFSIALGLQILYSQAATGKVIGGLILICYISMMVFFYRKPLNFGQFKQHFAELPRHQNFYIGMIIIRFAISLILILASQSELCGFLALGFVVLSLLYILIFRPYLKNVRPAINLLVMAGILAVQSYYKLDYNSSDATFASTYLPLFILILLLVVLLVNVVFMILHLRQKKQFEDQTNKYAKAKLDNIDIQMSNQLTKQMEIIAQIQMSITPMNFNLIKMQQRDDQSSFSDRQLVKGLSELKQIHRNIKISSNNPLLQDNTDVYNQI